MDLCASPLLPRNKTDGTRTNAALSNKLILLEKSGAGEGIRTLDPDLGKVVLYP